MAEHTDVGRGLTAPVDLDLRSHQLCGPFRLDESLGRLDYQKSTCDSICSFGQPR